MLKRFHRRLLIAFSFPLALTACSRPPATVAPPPDTMISSLVYLPDQCFVAMSLDTQALTRSAVFPVWRALDASSVGGMSVDEALRLEWMIGCPLTEIGRITIGSGLDYRRTILVEFVQPVQVSALTAKTREMVTGGFGMPAKLLAIKYKTEQVGQHQLHIKDGLIDADPGLVGGSDNPVTLCQIDDRTVLYGLKKPLEQVLQRGRLANVPADLAGALRGLDTTQTIWAAANLKLAPAEEDMPRLPGEVNLLLDGCRANRADLAQLTLGAAEKATLTVKATFPSGELADAFQRSLESKRQALKKDQKLPPPLVTDLDATRLQRPDSTAVTIQTEVTKQSLVEVLQMNAKQAFDTVEKSLKK